MKRKGFTLIEVMMGLFLLGLVSATVLPIFNTTFMNINKQRQKAEMLYASEMAIEKLKAYNPQSSVNLYIYNTDVKEIIQLFYDNDRVDVEISEGGEYTIKIVKEDKSKFLWFIEVFVYNKDWGNKNHVELEAYLQKK
ncbi:MAG: type II secretion system GspH family protein [Tissierellaceae bacterium]|nr:type II secretion system GspH family protein [Tissierellaceae bacterium]